MITDTPRSALCIGETMVLVTPRHAEPLSAAEEVVLGVAGAESNVALYLQDLGVSTRWFSRIGDDPLGERILRHLSRHSVGVTDVIRDPDRSTGVFFKDPGASVHYYRRCSAASAMSVADLRRIRLEEVDLVHISGITPALSSTCDQLISELLAMDRRPPISFDVNYRPALWPSRDAATRLAHIADCADITFVGRDEAESLWGTTSPHEVRRHLAKVPHLVVKDAAIGATAWNYGEAVFVPAPVVDVVEPVGAGDAFAAGYLAAWLEGAPSAQRLGQGHATAARALASTLDFQPRSQTR